MLGRRFRAIHLERLYRIVERAERDVADGLFIAGHAGQYDAGLVGDLRIRRGVVNLFTRVVLLLHAGQLDKRAARARAVLAGDNSDRTGNAGSSFAALGLCAVRTVGIIVAAAAAGQCAAQQQAAQQQGYAFFHN